MLVIACAPMLWGITVGRRVLRPIEFPVHRCAGEVRLVTDPVPSRFSVDVIVSLNGERFRARARGLGGRRVSARRSGQRVFMVGTCRPLSPAMAKYDRVRHVRGIMNVTEVSEEWADDSLLARSSNRVHGWLAFGARSLPAEDRALFLGLVMGDDRDQPRTMVDDFRASGLAHLTAVSGQNVAFVLAVAGVVLRRLRPIARLVATSGVILWFVVMTRAEPSVIRAAVMASASATCFALGIRAEPRRLMPLLVLGVMVVDPMLAHSVGFALSVGATFGLMWLSSSFARWCGRGWASRGLATTLAAVCGTAPVSLLVFGRVPAVSLLCNPLAVPIAGAVMLLGIPVAVACAALPAHFASVVMFPIAVAVRLVWWIAHVGASVSPAGPANIACWLGVLVVLRRRAVAG